MPQLTGQHSDAAHTNRLHFSERLTCTVAEACKATGLGRTKMYALMAEGCLSSTTVGRRRLIFVESLSKLLSTGK